MNVLASQSETHFRHNLPHRQRRGGGGGVEQAPRRPDGIHLARPGQASPDIGPNQPSPRHPPDSHACNQARNDLGS